MAVFAVYIEKETSYHGEVRPLGNTYHYKTNTFEGFNDQAVAEEIQRREADITMDNVTFTRWRTWGPTDVVDPTQTIIRDEGLFEAKAGLMPSLLAYKEACLLASWEISRSPVTNRRRWLRKFIRLGRPGGVDFTANMMSGEVALTPGLLDELKTKYIDPITNLDPALFMDNDSLCARDGSTPIAPGLFRPYYYTRDIGR